MHGPWRAYGWSSYRRSDARRALPDGLVDALDEAEKLLMPVAWFALGQHGSGGDVECGE